MYQSAELLIERGVPREVADFLTKCARRECVLHVVDAFDRCGRRPVDPTRWFQGRLLPGSFEHGVSKFGRKLQEVPKGLRPPITRYLPKRPERRSKNPPRTPTGAVVN